MRATVHAIALVITPPCQFQPAFDAARGTASPSFRIVHSVLLVLLAARVGGVAHAADDAVAVATRGRA